MISCRLLGKYYFYIICLYGLYIFVDMFKRTENDGHRRDGQLPDLAQVFPAIEHKSETEILTVHKTPLSKHYNASVAVRLPRRYKKRINSLCELEISSRYLVRRDEWCPCVPGKMHGRVIPNITMLGSLTWHDAEKLSMAQNLGLGGHGKPSTCSPRRRLAIVIPYRDRERHLRAFLTHHHPIFQRQLLDYQIFVIEQEKPYMFNKGAMMNAGYLEVVRMYRPDCVLFHDVDLLAENDQNMFVCTDQHVHHVAAYIDTFNYRLKYPELLGGAILISGQTFEALNGYSNSYYGWGGEDDDFQNRITWKWKKVYRTSPRITRYTAFTHPSDTGNPPSKDRKKGHQYTPDLYASDGLNTVQYRVLHKKAYTLYTWIQIRLTETSANAEFYSQKTDYFVYRWRCIPEPSGQRHEMSRVTCTHLCDLEETCIGFYYVTDQEASDYCILLVEVCSLTKTSNTQELHLKPRP